MVSLEQACDQFVTANRAKKESGKLAKGINDTKKFIISELDQRNAPFIQIRDDLYIVLKKKMKCPPFLDVFKEVYDTYQQSKGRMIDENEASVILDLFKEKRKQIRESSEIGFQYDLIVSAIQPPGKESTSKRRRE